jgi:Na+-translocating ferredoxin:NAD+ oxidoreductase RnfG subunit
MKINKDGHIFTISFTFFMTVVLVFPLTLAYVGTKPIADAYWLDQHVIKTLASMGLPADAKNIEKAREEYKKLDKYTIGKLAKDSAGKLIVVYDTIDYDAIAKDPTLLHLFPSDSDRAALAEAKMTMDDVVSKALQDNSYTGNIPAFFYVTEADGQKRFGGDFTGPGLWGNVSLAVGSNADLSEISGMRVLFNVETPGLGGRIEEPGFTAQFDKIKPASNVGLVFNHPGTPAPNGFDAISGATITSAAIKDTINQRALVLLKAFVAQKGGS